MKKLYLAFLLSLCCGVWVLPGMIRAALTIPPVPDHYVTDGAGLLSTAGREALEEKLAQFERDTSNQILVATFPNLQGEAVEDFSIRLAEKWKPGQSGRDNGAILIVGKEDRKLRIEVGYGLEGAIPDAIAKAIVQNEIQPAFKQGNFEVGITQGVEAILKATAGEYKGKPVQEGTWLPMIFLIFIFILIILAWALNRMQSYGLHHSGSYGYRGWGGGSWGGSGSSWGGSGSGWGGGGGGGFSSGGGSFGGGGASGSW